MPEKRFDAMGRELLESALNYRPGYDWAPDRFGPPPGIPIAKKNELDGMSDRDYLYAIMRLTQEEKESLMISERERRRSFAAHWPVEHIVKGHDLAKEGFYYTGISDKVQCAFCSGIIRNWEPGDTAAEAHKSFFSYCKMVLRRPCFNIPYDEVDLTKELMSQQLHIAENLKKVPNLKELGISDNKPNNHSFSVFGRRLESYAGFPRSSGVTCELLAEAGFYYSGSEDKVICFWCNGMLEQWKPGDDAWIEHAKWYPGCAFVRQTKGAAFIKDIRSNMSPEDLETAKTLTYNCGDVTFLDAVEEPPSRAEKHPKFEICLKLGYSREMITNAYGLNDGKEYENIQDLISVLEALENNNDESLRNTLSKLLKPKEPLTGSVSLTRIEDVSESVDVVLLIKKQEDMTNKESQLLVQAMLCHICGLNTVGAVILPCGHFCICQSCSKTHLPSTCPYCAGQVKGACRAFLS